MALPLYRFGVVADPQYADKEDGHVEGRTQRHREVPPKLTAAVDDWLAHVAPEPAGSAPGLAFVLTLGDLIDGRPTLAETLEDLEVVGRQFDRLAAAHVPVHHVVGNHDLAAPRAALLSRLRPHAPGAPATGAAAAAGAGSSNNGGSYYSAAVAPGWRLLVLDTTDLGTTSGHPQDSPEAEEARQYMASHPLSEENPHIVDWNSGVAAAQRKWVEGELAAAAAVGERVLVAAHHPVGAGSGRATHQAWNWRELHQLLRGAASTAAGAPVVTVVFTGHDHVGGYSEVDGIHYVTLEAMLEAPTGSTAYAYVDVFPDRVEISGRGTVTSRTLPLKP